MSEPCPVFIGGAGRSGTTLVVDMLGLHPRISPIYETDFVLQLIDLLFSGKHFPPKELGGLVTSCMNKWTRPLPKRPHNKREHERYHHGPHYVLFGQAFALERTAEFVAALNRDETESGFRQFLLALFAEHCRLDNKAGWANKTPAYVHHLPLLHRLFPMMRFIHCIRDGRDVACSVVTRPWGPKNFSQAAEWWLSKVKPGVDFGQQYSDRCLEVRYEDLVRNPEHSLGQLINWLGEEGDPAAILKNYQDGAVRLDHSRIGQWSRSFSAEDSRSFRSLAGDMLDHFGYGD